MESFKKRTLLVSKIGLFVLCPLLLVLQESAFAFILFIVLLSISAKELIDDEKRTRVYSTLFGYYVIKDRPYISLAGEEVFTPIENLHLPMEYSFGNNNILYLTFRNLPQKRTDWRDRISTIVEGALGIFFPHGAWAVLILGILGTVITLYESAILFQALTIGILGYGILVIVLWLIKELIQDSTGKKIFFFFFLVGIFGVMLSTIGVALVISLGIIALYLSLLFLLAKISGEVSTAEQEHALLRMNHQREVTHFLNNQIPVIQQSPHYKDCLNDQEFVLKSTTYGVSAEVAALVSCLESEYLLPSIGQNEGWQVKIIDAC